MEQGKTHVPKSKNWHSHDNSPDIAVSYNRISDKGVGGDIVELSNSAERNDELAQTVQKHEKSVQQLPKKILSIEDSASLAKQSLVSPMKTSSSDIKSVYVTKPQNRRQAGREGIESVHHNESPSNYDSEYAESPGRRQIAESPVHRYTGRNTTNGGGSLKPTIVNSQRRGALHANRENGGSQRGTKESHDHGQDQSPLTHHYQGRLGNKLEGTSPSWERRIVVEGGVLSPSTPGRSKLRGANTRSDDTPDRSAPLPKFGDWNEKDPTSADDFTHIFNQRRQEKLTGVSMVPAMPPGTPSRISSRKQANVSQCKSSVWCCMAPRTFE